jgi:hypothetical protein
LITFANNSAAHSFNLAQQKVLSEVPIQIAARTDFSSDFVAHRSNCRQLPAAIPFKRFGVPTNELFDDPNNAKLKNRKPLDEAGAFLEENRFGLVVIASSETSGDSEKDRVLTQAQAKVVRDYIVQHFRVNDSRIKTIGIGKKTQPGDASEIQILIYSQIPPVSTDSDRAPRSR